MAASPYASRRGDEAPMRRRPRSDPLCSALRVLQDAAAGYQVVGQEAVQGSVVASNEMVADVDPVLSVPGPAVQLQAVVGEVDSALHVMVTAATRRKEPQ